MKKFHDTNSKRGGVITPATYDEVYTNAFSAIGLRDGRWFLLNGEGQEIFEAEDFGQEEFDYRPFRRGGKWGVVSIMDGSIVLPADYDDIQICLGKIFMRKDGLWGFMSDGTLEKDAPKEMRLVCEPQFSWFGMPDDAEDITPIRVTLNDEQGYVDRNGHLTKAYDEAYYVVSPRL